MAKKFVPKGGKKEVVRRARAEGESTQKEMSEMMRGRKKAGKKK